MNNLQIAAITIGYGISMFILSTFIFFLFKNHTIQNKIFFIKKWIFIFSLLLINALGCALIYYTSNLQIIIYIIVTLKFKDLLMAIMFIFNRLYKTIYKPKYPTFPNKKEQIVVFVPIYKESIDQVEMTIDSILQNKIGFHELLTVIISDGINDYSQLLTDIVSTKQHKYISWRNDSVKITIRYGYRNNQPVIFIQKDKNMGKKDSLILFNDLFNHIRENADVLNNILRNRNINDIELIYQINQFDYLYCTDGDTIIDENAINNLLQNMKTRNAVAGCGIANIDYNYGNYMMNILQNYQYLYGQFLRRTNEDFLNQVLCLPGCNTMLKVSEEYKHSLKLYSENTNNNNLVLSCVQNVGTDRRFTSSLVYTNKNAKIILDDTSHAYTVVPNTFYTYLDQRKRWCHNMYFNNINNIIAPNINILLRLLNLIDFLRMSLIYFRLFNTLYFIYILSISFSHNILELIPYFIILIYPTLCFFIYSLFNPHLKKEYFKFLLALIFNKIFVFITTNIIFSLMLWNIGYNTWSKEKRPHRLSIHSIYSSS